MVLIKLIEVAAGGSPGNPVHNVCSAGSGLHPVLALCLFPLCLSAPLLEVRGRGGGQIRTGDHRYLLLHYGLPFDESLHRMAFTRVIIVHVASLGWVLIVL